MDTVHQNNEIISQRYRIIKKLGEGGAAITYEAEDLQNNQHIALKALSLRKMRDWKMIELFEREARILEKLNHPNIPRYLDYFQVNNEQNSLFYIAQELAVGQSLITLIENGWHPDESQVIKIARQVLEILVYLQNLIPPVIHRDIKPQNIILTNDEKLFLVDFGSVQDTYHNTVTGGSTIVGTFGYMSPEQFRGQAVLSTDLYGLATTLLFLLTRKSPAELPQSQLKINFNSSVQISKKFAKWLDKMLEPVIEDRFTSAQEALNVLLGKKPLIAKKPPDTKITLIRQDKILLIEIPPPLLRSEHGKTFGLITLIWDGLLALLVWFILKLSLFLQPSTVIILGLFCIVGLWIFSSFMYGALSKIKLTFEQDIFIFSLQKWLLGMSYEKKRGKINTVSNVKLKPIFFPFSKTPITVIKIKLKWRKLSFGTFLTEAEKEWLTTEINDFLHTFS